MNFFQDRQSLQRIESDCWKLLTQSVKDSTSGWKLPVFGTTGGDHCHQRIVVLRQVNTAARQIVAHTDVRSAKVEQLRVNPKSSWLFWDSERKVQLILTGNAVVHSQDQLADDLWNSEAASSLRGYLAPHAPGTVSKIPEINLPVDMRNRIPSRDELKAGRKNFAVISCSVSQAECVMLKSDGNLRTRFCYDESGLTTADWLAP